MTQNFETFEFTPEMIYEELLKQGIEFELNEEYKYLEEHNSVEKNNENLVLETSIIFNNEYLIYCSKALENYYFEEHNHSENEFLTVA